MNRLARGSALLAAAALLGACTTATKTQDPRMELRDAVHADTTAKHVAFELKVGATPAALKGLAAADKSSSSTLTDKEITQILGSSLKVSADQPQKGKPETAAVALEVHVDNTDLVDVRVVDKLLYLRADVTKIRSLASISDAQFAQVTQIASQPGFEFVTPAVRGEWLKLDPKPLQDFAQGLGSKSGSSAAAAPSVNPEQAKAEIQRFVDGVFSSDATVTRVGKAGDSDHLKVDVPLRKVYTRFQAVYPQLTKGIPGAGTQTLPPLTDVPDKVLHFDAFVSKGALNRLDFDVTQLSTTPVTTGAVNLRIDITRPSTAITAPPHSTEVNLLRLLGQFAGGLGGLGGTGAG